MKSIAPLLLCASLLSACTVVPESNVARSGSGTSYSAPSRTSSYASSSSVRSPMLAQPAPAAMNASEAACFSQLNSVGARFTPVADAYTGEGCSTIGTVQMSALAGEHAQLAVSNMGPLQCSVSTAFAAWARYGVDRAAQQILGSPIQRIETFGTYSCRNVAGSQRRSAHATAGAIDISGFVLADGRRISVADDWSGGTAQEKEFLRTVQNSACRRFDTVLGPEYNTAHHDHFHLEGVIDGSSFCR